MFDKQARFLTANLYIIKIQRNVNSIEHGIKSRGMVVPKQNTKLSCNCKPLNISRKKKKGKKTTHTHAQEAMDNYKGLWMTWNEGLMIHDAETVAP